MASFQKLEKKQVPQVIGLGIASCGLLGYFAFKMITPTASAAPMPVAASSPVVASATVAPLATPSVTAASAASPIIPNAPPPTDGMRNPFIQTISSIAAPVTVASAPSAALPSPAAAASRSAPSSFVSSGAVTVPPAQLGSLPSIANSSVSSAAGSAVNLPPLPVILPPPQWTVTGVLQNGVHSVAILRSGSSRQFAQAGQMVDSDYRLVDVTRSFVVLRHGDKTYTLPLGGAKAADSPAASVTGSLAQGAAMPIPAAETAQEIAGTAAGSTAVAAPLLSPATH